MKPLGSAGAGSSQNGNQAPGAISSLAPSDAGSATTRFGALAAAGLTSPVGVQLKDQRPAPVDGIRTRVGCGACGKTPSSSLLPKPIRSQPPNEQPTFEQPFTSATVEPRCLASCGSAGRSTGRHSKPPSVLSSSD